MPPNVTERRFRLAKLRGVTAQVTQKLRSDAGDNRRRILAAARVAFVREGFDVPVREIARRAEVAVATVYRRFPTKQALFAEAFSAQLAMCSEIVEEGLAAADPWHGFRHVIEKLTEANARDAGFRTLLTRATDLSADRRHTMRLLLELMRRAKEAGELRTDIVPEDIVLTIMANEGLLAGSPGTRVAASRRFAALMLQSFRVNPDAAPLPRRSGYRCPCADDFPAPPRSVSLGPRRRKAGAMRKLIYGMNVTLDGYIAAPGDPAHPSLDQEIGWSVPSEELFQWWLDQERATSMSLYGRRLWETMSAHWPTADQRPGATAAEIAFARNWRDTPKVVFSSTLGAVGWNSRLVTGDAVAEITRLKAEDGGPMEIAGATLAAAAMRAGLIDEYALATYPVLIGGGTPFFTALDSWVNLDLVETRTFPGGVVLTRYETRR